MAAIVNWEWKGKPPSPLEAVALALQLWRLGGSAAVDGYETIDLCSSGKISLNGSSVSGRVSIDSCPAQLSAALAGEAIPEDENSNDQSEANSPPEPWQLRVLVRSWEATADGEGETDIPRVDVSLPLPALHALQTTPFTVHGGTLTLGFEHGHSSLPRRSAPPPKTPSKPHSMQSHSTSASPEGSDAFTVSTRSSSASGLQSSKGGEQGDEDEEADADGWEKDSGDGRSSRATSSPQSNAASSPLAYDDERDENGDRKARRSRSTEGHTSPSRADSEDEIEGDEASGILRKGKSFTGLRDSRGGSSSAVTMMLKQRVSSLETQIEALQAQLTETRAKANIVAEAEARCGREIKLRQMMDARRVAAEADVEKLKGELKVLETARMVSDKTANENADVALAWKERSEGWEAAYDSLKKEHDDAELKLSELQASLQKAQGSGAAGASSSTAAAAAATTPVAAGPRPRSPAGGASPAPPRTPPAMSPLLNSSGGRSSPTSVVQGPPSRRGSLAVPLGLAALLPPPGSRHASPASASHAHSSNSGDGYGGSVPTSPPAHASALEAASASAAAAAVMELQERHAARCKELEAQVALLKGDCESARTAASKEASRCRSLRHALSAARTCLAGYASALERACVDVEATLSPSNSASNTATSSASSSSSSGGASATAAAGSSSFSFPRDEVRAALHHHGSGSAAGGGASSSSGRESRSDSRDSTASTDGASPSDPSSPPAAVDQASQQQMHDADVHIPSAGHASLAKHAAAAVAAALKTIDDIRRSASESSAAAGERQKAAVATVTAQFERQISELKSAHAAAIEERSRLVREWEGYASHWEGRGREAERLNGEWEKSFDELQVQVNTTAKERDDFRSQCDNTKRELFRLTDLLQVANAEVQSLRDYLIALGHGASVSTISRTVTSSIRSQAPAVPPTPAPAATPSLLANPTRPQAASSAPNQLQPHTQSRIPPPPSSQPPPQPSISSGGGFSQQQQQAANSSSGSGRMVAPRGGTATAASMSGNSTSTQSFLSSRLLATGAPLQPSGAGLVSAALEAAIADASTARMRALGDGSMTAPAAASTSPSSSAGASSSRILAPMTFSNSVAAAASQQQQQGFSMQGRPITPAAAGGSSSSGGVPTVPGNRYLGLMMPSNTNGTSGGYVAASGSSSNGAIMSQGVPSHSQQQSPAAALSHAASMSSSAPNSMNAAQALQANFAAATLASSLRRASAQR